MEAEKHDEEDAVHRNADVESVQAARQCSAYEEKAFHVEDLELWSFVCVFADLLSVC